MFCFLVIDEDLEIVKVAFAVIAPRTRENLLDVGVLTLLLCHVDRVWEVDGRCV